MEYTYEALLDAQFTDTSLLKIIQRGHDLGFQYYAYEDYDFKHDESSKIDNGQILKKIVADNEPQNKNFEYCPGVGIFYFDNSFVPPRNNEENYSIGFILRIVNKSGNIWISEQPLGYWSRNFVVDAYKNIDIGRHMQLLLKLCKDFSVIKIETNRF